MPIILKKLRKAKEIFVSDNKAPFDDGALLLCDCNLFRILYHIENNKRGFEMVGKSKIKFCIWDVGGVIYSYSLKFLNEFMKSRTEDMELFNANNGAIGFDYDNFMRGKVSFETLCKQLCKYCGVKYQSGIDTQINLAFRDGIGEFKEVTHQLMEKMKDAGIENGLLSNAFPNLKDTADMFGLINQDYVFCSFDLGMLKPDVRIFEAVKEKLGCAYEEILFVDDKPANVAAAKSLGINALLFDEEKIEKDIYKLLGWKKKAK